MTNPVSSLGKRHSRKILRELLSDTTRSERSAWSNLICDGLSEWIAELDGIRIVATYAAMESEANLASLHPRMGDEYEFAYPLVVDKALQFHLVDDPSQLRQGAFGILEPDPAIHRKIEPADLDLCLCPGLGFTLNGIRLGRGKAYYDSALPHLNPDTPRIGTAFSLQVRNSLPCERHDILMTHLSTEQGVRPIQATS